MYLQALGQLSDGLLQKERHKQEVKLRHVGVFGQQRLQHRESWEMTGVAVYLAYCRPAACTAAHVKPWNNRKKGWKKREWTTPVWSFRSKEITVQYYSVVLSKNRKQVQLMQPHKPEQTLQSHGNVFGYSPSTVPILLVSTESVCSSQPPPHRPSLKRLRMLWLLSTTTRIQRATVTVLEWMCSSMNISSQSNPSVRTSSSHALQVSQTLNQTWHYSSHYNMFLLLIICYFDYLCKMLLPLLCKRYLEVLKSSSASIFYNTLLPLDTLLYTLTVIIRFKVIKGKKIKMKHYCALTVHFSLELKSSLSKMSSSRLRSRITFEESSPPKSSSFPGQNAGRQIHCYRGNCVMSAESRVWSQSYLHQPSPHY